MQPRQIRETFTPVEPRLVYSMRASKESVQMNAARLLITELRAEAPSSLPVDGSTRPRCRQRWLHTAGIGACPRSPSAKYSSSPLLMRNHCGTCVPPAFAAAPDSHENASALFCPLMQNARAQHGP